MRTSAETHRFALLADLHLSDLSGTAAHQALQWAVAQVESERPEFLAVAGDVTTYGTARSTALFLDALRPLRVPVLFTPGNAERRSPEAMPLLAELCAPQRRYGVFGDLLALCPDTSTGTLPEEERVWLRSIVTRHSGVARRILITHYPLDRLVEECRAWVLGWMAENGVELLAAAHTHLAEVREHGDLTEVVTRGLDPDKAIGDLPGLDFLESGTPGIWTRTFHPWDFSLELLPADLSIDVSPVGWSIHGDPIEAADETLERRLSCLELRPTDLNFSPTELGAALRRLREAGPLFLSYHLPNLSWNGESGRIEGREMFQAHLERAGEAEVDSLTVHVPRAPVAPLESGGMRTALYAEFVGLYAELLQESARAGVRIAIENLHNPPDTAVADPQRRFATTIDEYVRWLDAMQEGLPQAKVGAHLDVGHARNNGGPLDNLQPLGDWYARLGRRILGYHIHQVGKHPETGRLANHLEIASLFGQRISYAGFLWAWSTRQIGRRPLFVEVRDAQARRRTARRLQELFAQRERIGSSVELPDRDG